MNKYVALSAKNITLFFITIISMMIFIMRITDLVSTACMIEAEKNSSFKKDSPCCNFSNSNKCC